MSIIKSMKVALSAFFLVGAINAQAVTIVPGPGTYTYQGPATMSQGSFSLSCTLTLVGDVDYTSSGGLEIVVTDGSSTGGLFGLCALVDFVFPWTAVVDPADVPTSADAAAPITFNDVFVSGPGGDCTSSPVSVDAIFSPVNPSSPNGSSFTFNTTIGNCGVAGTPANSSVYVTNP